MHFAPSGPDFSVSWIQGQEQERHSSPPGPARHQGPDSPPVPSGKRGGTGGRRTGAGKSEERSTRCSGEEGWGPARPSSAWLVTRAGETDPQV